MILEALVKYYEQLSADGKIPKYGWSQTNVSYAIELDEAGQFIRMQSLKTEAQHGKKTVMVPRSMVLPAAVKKTSGILPNFLFGNIAYLLGIDYDSEEKKNVHAKERAALAFESSKELHNKILGTVDDSCAKAIFRYFNQWDPSVAYADERLKPYIEDLIKGANICFLVNDVFAQDVKAIQDAWDYYFRKDENGTPTGEMIDLITGEMVAPVLIHPVIKGIKGAQSSGASLISFNAPADCSFNREQNLNAPVGKYAAFAYTSALNYLLSQRDGQNRTRFSKMIGDTTLVYWSENAQESYQDLLASLIDGDSKEITDTDLQRIVASVCIGNPIDWNSSKINPEKKFYLVGIAPNAARLSVRFDYCNAFGEIIKNIDDHYRRLQIFKTNDNKMDILPLWAMLRETANQNSQNKNPSPQLSEDILKSIVTGCNYPSTLFLQIELRIKADRDINWRRASIIKAYFLKNKNSEIDKEVLTVKLNEDTVYLPYVLGRLFSLLEEIQAKANPGINTTIKDKYFTSACATPSVIFPVLLSLSEKHLRKMNEGSRIYYSQRLQQLMSMITETYPVHLSLDEQGVFQLGYYHQTQKRFTKKTEEK